MAKRTKGPQSASERATIAHERTSGYRMVVADGALIRRQKNDLLVTFYYDDVPVRSEMAEFIKATDGSTNMRPLGNFNQEFVRYHEVTVRMGLEEAAALLIALLIRLRREAPELLKARGIEMIEEERVQ